MERSSARLARLQELTVALSAAAGTGDIADAIFELALDVLGARSGTLAFAAPGGPVRLSHGAGRRGSDPGAAESGPGLRAMDDAAASRQPIWLPSPAAIASRYPEAEPLRRLHGDGAWAAVPLVVRSEVVGVLGLAFARPRAFGAEERAFAVALAQNCAQALERARLYESEKRLRAEAEQAAALVRRTLRERDESIAILDALFANAPVGLALLDRDLRFVRVNPAMAEMNGVPAEQHVGRVIWEVLPQLDLEEVVRKLEAVMDSGRPLLDQEVSGETQARPGQVRHWLQSWFPVGGGDKAIGVGALVREITGQRQAEEFQRQLLGIVGHDLRSPLLAITSSVSLLQHGNPDERSARTLARIQHSAGRIEGIIQAIADFTQVRVGRGIPLDVAPADLEGICRGVAEEAEAGNPGRSVVCEAQGDLRGSWDAVRIGQALANLAANALKYGDEGAPVRIACRGDGGELSVDVHNQGPPIPPEFLPDLFQPFRRSSEARASRKKGLGLGLFIARQIALAHGGTLEARSSAAEGTTFTLRLPRVARPPEPS